jgi:biotin carboxyl carrier protein
MKTYKFTIHGNEYEVELRQLEENTARIEVNGTLYEVEIHQEKKVSKTPTLVRSEMPAPSRSDSKIKKNISSGTVPVKAPLPGNIMQIYVKPGDEVKRSDKLLMYEAMKMENMVLAEKDGKIISVKVNVGDAVLQGDVLMEMS